MDEIARLAGIAKGTIYYHFKSKEELFMCLIDEGMDRLLNCIINSLRNKKTSHERLRTLLETQLEFYNNNHELTKLLLTESLGSEQRQYHLRNKIRSYLDLIDGVLREGSRQGDFSFIHPRETATAIFGALSILSLDRFYNLESSVDECKEEKLAILYATAHQLLLP